MYALNSAAKTLNPTVSGRNAWEAVPWGKLTAPIVRAIMARYSGSPATRNKLLAALKGVARSGWEMRQLDTDELLRIREIKGDAGTREVAGRYVPSGEIGALLRACAEDGSAAGARDAAMIAIAAATGARRAEIAGILAEDVSQPEPGRFEIRIIGKRNKMRRLYLNGNAALMLSDWLTLRFAPGCNPSGPLFWAIRKGGRVQPDNGVEFLRFCGLGCDEQNDSHEQQQNRSPLRPGV
jgi:site-specific recombinase XerC